MKIGNREINTKNHTYVMGILNITPDSFSDGGKYSQLDKALFRVETMIEEGMDILDIGGESTRPGYTQLTDDEEIARIMPVVKAVKERFEIPISLDTYKSGVAKAGVLAGVDLINDIWGLRYDSEMSKVIKEGNVSCVLMHNRKEAAYNCFIQDVIADLKESIEIARRAGISENQIILDPGVGFAKTYEQNLEIINKVDLLTNLGYPTLLATSRKSVIGLTLDLPSSERLEGTLATTVLAVMRGCSFVRVHDIKENVRVVKMTEAIRNS